MKHHFDTLNSDFKCMHCNHHISTDPFLSGVNNRNHCPYCLYSRHMDLREAGDRLSACRGAMQPVGLALKQINNKYGSRKGELMLVHACSECGRISANRIAADDIADHILDVFERSLSLSPSARKRIETAGVQLLTRADEAIIHARLFGWGEITPAQRAYAD